jgi:hypothetical protein
MYTHTPHTHTHTHVHTHTTYALTSVLTVGVDKEVRVVEFFRVAGLLVKADRRIKVQPLSRYSRPAIAIRTAYALKNVQFSVNSFLLFQMKLQTELQMGMMKKAN